MKSRRPQPGPSAAHPGVALWPHMRPQLSRRCLPRVLSSSPQVKIDLPFDEAIRRVLRVKPEHRTAKKPAPKKRKPKKRS